MIRELGKVKEVTKGPEGDDLEPPIPLRPFDPVP